jgi:hypothetical protein
MTGSVSTLWADYGLPLLARQNFSLHHNMQTDFGSTKPPVEIVGCSSLGVEAAGALIWSLSVSSVEVRNARWSTSCVEKHLRAKGAVSSVPQWAHMFDTRTFNGWLPCAVLCWCHGRELAMICFAVQWFLLIIFKRNQVIFTERRVRVVNTPASYSGSIGHKSRPGNRLSWLRIFGFFPQSLQATPGILA